jgi:hypothetical protein
LKAYAADAFEEIGSILASNRRREQFARGKLCAIQNGGQLSECWCHGAGPLGGNLPCPQRQDVYEGCGYGVKDTCLDSLRRVAHKSSTEIVLEALDRIGEQNHWTYP